MRRDCGENVKVMIVEPLTVGPIVGYTTDTTCRLWGRGPDAGPILGDDAFTRVSLDAGATVMRVDVYDRKGGLLDGVALPL